MISLYAYDTSNGRVLAVGNYDERGDGATSRAIGLGTIDPATQYAPGGVKTARPLFDFATLTLSKTQIFADAVDSATIAGVPNGTLVKVFKDQDQFPRAVVTVTDGSVVFKVDTAGVYRIRLGNFPIQETTFTVTAV